MCVLHTPRCVSVGECVRARHSRAHRKNRFSSVPALDAKKAKSSALYAYIVALKPDFTNISWLVAVCFIAGCVCVCVVLCCVGVGECVCARTL